MASVKAKAKKKVKAVKKAVKSGARSVAKAVKNIAPKRRKPSLAKEIGALAERITGIGKKAISRAIKRAKS